MILFLRLLLPLLKVSSVMIDELLDWGLLIWPAFTLSMRLFEISLSTRFRMKVGPRLLKSKLRLSILSELLSDSTRGNAETSVKFILCMLIDRMFLLFWINSARRTMLFWSLSTPVLLKSRSSIQLFLMRALKICYIAFALILSFPLTLSFLSEVRLCTTWTRFTRVSRWRLT